MDIKEIEEIAKETGMSMCMYDRPRLRHVGDDKMQFVSSGKLTPYGENLVAFANAVEAKLNAR